MTEEKQKCPWPQCAKRIALDKFMCLNHWRRLPKPIQNKILWRWDLVEREMSNGTVAGLDEALANHSAAKAAALRWAALNPEV